MTNCGRTWAYGSPWIIIFMPRSRNVRVLLVDLFTRLKKGQPHINKRIGLLATSENFRNDLWSLYAKHKPEAPAPIQMMRISLSWWMASSFLGSIPASVVCSGSWMVAHNRGQMNSHIRGRAGDATVLIYGQFRQTIEARAFCSGVTFVRKFVNGFSSLQANCNAAAAKDSQLDCLDDYAPGKAMLKTLLEFQACMRWAPSLLWRNMRAALFMYVVYTVNIPHIESAWLDA